MDQTRTLRGAIEQIVREETRYLRHYWGEVLNNTDELNRGRVLVSVPELGWNSEDTGAWCFPRQMHSLSVPAVGEYIEVYFVAGDPNRPAYLGTFADFDLETVPQSYVDPSTHILFEDPENTTLVQYNGTNLDLGKEDLSGIARIDDETQSSSSEDNAFWAFFSAFFSIVTGAPINEPGSGSPSAFQAALSAAISGAGGTPTSMTGKITTGSDQVRAGNG